jgi:hypothetical protein
MALYLSSLGQLPALMGGHDLPTRRKWEGFVYDKAQAARREGAAAGGTGRAR